MKETTDTQTLNYIIAAMNMHYYLTEVRKERENKKVPYHYRQLEPAPDQSVALAPEERVPGE